MIVKFYKNVVMCLMLIFSAFPILPRIVESIIIIILALLSLIYFMKEGKKIWKLSDTKQVFEISIVFWVYFCTMFYTKNISYGLDNVITMLPVIIIPLVFLVNKELLLTKKNIDIFINIYLISIFSFLTYLNLFIYKTFYITDFGTTEIRTLFEKSTNVHGTYFSVWIGFGVILILFKISENKKNILFLLTATPIILFFIYWQNIIAARMPLITTLFFLILFLFKNNFKILIILFVLSISTLIVFSNKDVFAERFKRLKSYDLTFPKGDYATNWRNISPEHVRNGIYYCSYLKIKEAPLLGVGLGDVNNQLQNCYDLNFTDTDTYKLRRYNSHSQYLDIVLTSGFIGFFIICYYQFKTIKKAIKSNKKVYLNFIFFFFFINIFENILNRQDGVIFFSLFNTILFFNEIIKNNHDRNYSNTFRCVTGCTLQ